MAFAITEKTQNVFGNKKVVTGVYTNTSSSTGGEVDTGLSVVEAFFLTPKGSSTSASQSVYNETLPLNSGDVTIVTTADEVGNFVAIGR